MTTPSFIAPVSSFAASQPLSPILPRAVFVLQVAVRQLQQAQLLLRQFLLASSRATLHREFPNAANPRLATIPASLVLHYRALRDSANLHSPRARKARR